MSKQLVKQEPKEFSFSLRILRERNDAGEGGREKKNKLFLRGNRTPLQKINIFLSLDDVCMANLFIYDQFM
jgi:hypothetical protein